VCVYICYLFIYLFKIVSIYMHFVFLVGGNKTTFTQKQGFFFFFFRFCDLPEVAIIHQRV
jgi:hypothetical protein